MATKLAAVPVPLKIEKNVPLVETPGARSRHFQELLRSMEVTDSIFVPNKKPEQVHSSVTHAKNKSGFRYAIRTVDGGVRIWRIA